jgi:hypothetical protein
MLYVLSPGFQERGGDRSTIPPGYSWIDFCSEEGIIDPDRFSGGYIKGLFFVNNRSKLDKERFHLPPGLPGVF